MNRQKADEYEKALIAIKNKIEQMRLQELNADIQYFIDDKNPQIYKTD